MKKIILLMIIAFLAAGIILAQDATGKMDAYCTLSGKKGGIITKTEIDSASMLVYVSPDTTWKVSSFKLSVAGKGIVYKEFYSHGKTLTDAMINYLKQVPSGAKFYIEYIRAGNGMMTRSVPPLSFVIGD